MFLREKLGFAAEYLNCESRRPREVTEKPALPLQTLVPVLFRQLDVSYILRLRVFKGGNKADTDVKIM